MPVTPSLSHMPSSHWPSAERAGCTFMFMALSFRSSSSSTGAPWACSTAAITSAALLTVCPPAFNMTSPCCTPASLAGEQLPSAVSTWERPATSTPFILICTPTTWPPKSSSWAKAGTVRQLTTNSVHSAVIIVFFMFSLPHISSHDSVCALRGKNKAGDACKKSYFFTLSPGLFIIYAFLSRAFYAFLFFITDTGNFSRLWKHGFSDIPPDGTVPKPSGGFFHFIYRSKGGSMSGMSEELPPSYQA